MTLESLTSKELEVVRQAMESTFRYFEFEFSTRLGISEKSMRALLNTWPKVDDRDDHGDACLAINNTLNDLLNGVGISDDEARVITGVNRDEIQRIFAKWRTGRGWGA